MWEPSPQRREAAVVTAYEKHLEATRGLTFADPQQLWQWSVTEIGDFWDSVWEFGQIVGERGDGPALADDRMPGARWYPEARLNYTENVLRHADQLDRSGRHRAPGGRQARRADAGRIAGPGRARGSGTAPARGGPGGPGLCRAADQRARRRRFPRDREPGRDLVELLTGLRRDQPRRPLRADRADGADRRGRLPLQRQAAAHAGPAGDVAGAAARAARHRGHLRTSTRQRTDPSLPRRHLLERVARPHSATCPPTRSRFGCPSTRRCGSCIHRVRPACPRRSCRARAASSSSTSKRLRCMVTCDRAAASSGSPRPAG